MRNLRWAAWHLGLPWVALAIVAIFPPQTDEAELTAAIVVPMGMCLLRAWLLAYKIPDLPRLRELRGARLGLLAYQWLFALSLIALLLFEFMAVAFVSIDERPLDAWLWLLGLYALYAGLAITAELAYRAGMQRLSATC